MYINGEVKIIEEAPAIAVELTRPDGSKFSNIVTFNDIRDADIGKEFIFSNSVDNAIITVIDILDNGLTKIVKVRKHAGIKGEYIEIYAIKLATTFEEIIS